MRRRRATERNLTQALRRWFTRRGSLVLEEVRVQPHSIDLVVFDPSTLSLSSVEVKVKDWRKALRQSAINRAFVDLSYVAMPKSAVEKLLKEMSPDLGIGVLSLRPTRKRIMIKLAKEATRDGKPNRYFRRAILAKLMSHYGDKLLQ